MLISVRRLVRVQWPSMCTDATAMPPEVAKGVSRNGSVHSTKQLGERLPDKPLSPPTHLGAAHLTLIKVDNAGSAVLAKTLATNRTREVCFDLFYVG